MLKRISILVKHFASVREITNLNEEKLNLRCDSIIQEALEELIRIHGVKLSEYLMDKKGDLKVGLRILVNGEIVTLRTRLNNNDILVIVPPVGGG
tara:strand:+ start:110 stop:394 length:285 start_codon:yes stop_codon:yes gene_type:complete